MESPFPTRSLVTSKKVNATPLLCRLAYMFALGRYYPSGIALWHYGDSRFAKLTKLLNEEEIRPDRYILFWFSVWNTRKYKSQTTRYPSPRQLEDKALVPLYRQQNGE